MYCPKCQKTMYCPCKNCAEKNKDKIVWVWVTPNFPIQCGNCGYIFPDFEGEEYRQYEKLNIRRTMEESEID